MPIGPISPGASKATGITKINNRLFLHSRPVESGDARTILSLFADWLDKQNEKVILIGHNVERFDSKHLWRIIEMSQLTERFSNIAGFVDTLPLLRSIYPNEKTHKQEHMYSLIVGGAYDAHNAMGDVDAIVRILHKLSVPSASLSSHSFTAKYVAEKHTYLQLKNAHLASLELLTDKNILTKSMAQKVAGSGLNIFHLKLARSRDEISGISQLFKEKFDGKARVTNSKKIIAKVNDFLSHSVV